MIGGMDARPARTDPTRERGLPDCDLCGSETWEVMAHWRDVPTHIGVCWDRPELARACRRGDILLAACRACGFVRNLHFDADAVDYAPGYDNGLHHSEHFRHYRRRLAEDLIRRHPLRGGAVVEIGCGDGSFLELLCALGGGRGTGYDPAATPGPRAVAGGGPVEVIAETFPPPGRSCRAQLVVALHVLEHVPEPAAFLRRLRRCLPADVDPVFHFQVPDAGFVLATGAPWDVIYEHCSYFTPGTLRRLFEACGFRVTDAGRTYHDQFAVVEARARRTPGGRRAGPLAAGGVGVSAGWGLEAQAETARWWRWLQGWRRAGRRVVLWGAGAKGVTFLNLVDGEGPAEGRSVAFAVDVNPGKQGRHVTGTGHAIRAPEALLESAPDVVVVANGAYRAEIAAWLGARGLAPQLQTLTGGGDGT